MKQKIKLWILLMEGWKEVPNTFLFRKEGYTQKLGQDFRIRSLWLDEAWSAQFATWKDYFKTKLFWLVFTMIVGALFFLFDDNSTVIENGISWFSWVGTIFFMYPLGWTLIAIAYMVWHGIKKLFNIK